MISHRERVLTALNHQPPDRIPLDLGSTIVTGIALGAYKRLLDFLRIEDESVREFDHAAQVAVVSDTVLDLLGIDTRGIIPGPPENFQNILTDDGTSYTDEWGLFRTKPPSADSYFVGNAPLAGEITRNDIIRYPWPDPSDPGRFTGLRNQIQSINARGDWAIVLTLPANFIAMSQMLRGFEDWYIDSKVNPQLLGSLMDQVLEIQLEMTRLILTEAGDLADIVINLDDLALQDRLLVSPATYQQLLQPRLCRLYEFITNNTEAKILHHTDGAVKPLLPSLIELGIDAINPLQVSAKGMDDLDDLKNKYGDQLTFWGGIDTQYLLPYGTPLGVHRAVEKTMNILNRDGGYVLTAVHNIQNDVPPENIIAMYEAALGKKIRSTDAR